MRILVDARTFNRFEARLKRIPGNKRGDVRLTGGKRGNSRNERYKAREIT